MALLQAGLTHELQPLLLSTTFGAWRQVVAFKSRLQQALKRYGQLKQTTLMKRLLLAFLTFTTFLVSGQTSVYHPFPDSNAVWNYHLYSNCFANGVTDEYYSITISGDTLINNLTYQKLVTPFVQSFSSSCIGSVSATYRGAVREVTQDKKIFFISPSETTEQLLYDFNMQVGDTVRGITQQPFTEPIDIVQSIDSVLVGFSFRKRWTINNWYGIQFIEGLGSTFGLIEASPGGISDQADFPLICFQQNGQTLYPNSIIDCDLITSIDTYDNVSNFLTIYPNPARGSITADFNGSVFKIIKLTDLLGNIILQQNPINQTQIHLNNLAVGTYILTATDNDNRTTNQKIISCP